MGILGAIAALFVMLLSLLICTCKKNKAAATNETSLAALEAKLKALDVNQAKIAELKPKVDADKTDAALKQAEVGTLKVE